MNACSWYCHFVAKRVSFPDQDNTLFSSGQKLITKWNSDTLSFWKRSWSRYWLVGFKNGFGYLKNDSVESEITAGVSGRKGLHIMNQMPSKPHRKTSKSRGLWNLKIIRCRIKSEVRHGFHWRLIAVTSLRTQKAVTKILKCKYSCFSLLLALSPHMLMFWPAYSFSSRHCGLTYFNIVSFQQACGVGIYLYPSRTLLHVGY